MQKVRPSRVGSFALGATLAGVGLALLAQNLGTLPPALSLWRFWPLLPLLLGVEYLVRQQLAQRKPEDQQALRLDGLAIVLAALALAGGIAYTAVPAEAVSLKALLGLGHAYEHRLEVRRELTDLKGVKRFVISQSGSVRLEGTDDNRITVVATVRAWAPLPEDAEALAQAVDLSLTSGTEARLEMHPPQALGAAQRWTVEYRVLVPKTLPVRAEVSAGELRALDIMAETLACRNGVLSVDSLHGDATLTGSFGRIELRGADGNVFIDGDHSNISVRDIAGRLRVANEFGNVHILNAAGTVEVRNDQGEIRASNDVPPAGDWLLDARMGSVDVDLPGNSSIALSAQSRFSQLSVPDWAQVSSSPNLMTATGSIGEGQFKLRVLADRGQATVVTR